MGRRSLLPLALAALVAGGGCGSDDDGSGSGTRATTEAAAPSERERALVERLREGGLVLAIRHAATDSGMDTTNDLRDCSKQRNLNDAGKRQSRAIGESIRSLGVPVGRVLASPFCRTRDTARLAFGRVRSSRALLSPEFLPGGAAEEGKATELQRLLSSKPAAGENLVLVSHGSGIDAAAGVNPEEGETVVVDPGAGRRGFEVLGRLEARDWERLARR